MLIPPECSPCLRLLRPQCIFEDEVGRELIVRLAANPKMSRALSTLQQPKILALSSSAEPINLDAARTAIDFETEQLDGRVERVVARLQRATFTGPAL